MKLVLTGFLSVITLFSYAQIDLEAGLVAYYPFNNSVEDESTFSNDASIVNNINFDEDEINNVTETVASFNGIDSYIRIPNAPQFNFGNEDAFTVSLWINVPENQLDLSGQVNDILGKWTNNGDVPYPFLLRLFNSTDDRVGTFNGAVYQGDGFGCATPPVINLYTETRINDNEWHHIIFTRTSDQRLQLYVDCELEVDVVDYTNCTTQNIADLLIGMREVDGVFSRAFNGKLDELRIYDRMLTEDEVNVLCGLVSSTIAENKPEEVKVFPNPVSRGNAIFFELASGQSPLHYRLFNSLGSFQGQYLPQDKISVPAGNYWMLLSLDDGQTLLKRLVVID